MYNKLDNDLYKFTMQNAVYQLFPDVDVEYKFQCRKEGVNLAQYASIIQDRIMDYCDNSQISERDLRYMMANFPYFSKGYFAFLKYHKSQYRNINIYTIGDDLELRIKGNWAQTILDEVPILSIISETYMTEEYKGEGRYVNKALGVLCDKEEILEGSDIRFADFGTRRRFSVKTHEAVLNHLSQNNKKMIGTSNLMFAKHFGISSIGTMAHEWLQAGQALTHPSLGQKYMLENWLKVYKGQLGIALTDIIGVDNFLDDFDLHLSNAYTGVRHDSGDPIVFGNKIIQHYKELGINPMTKTIVFSDGLNFTQMRGLQNHFENMINISFGIGTNLTNDIPGTEPLPIVIKLVKVNGLPVAKISDSSGKGMCEDEAYLNYLNTIKGE